MQSPNPKPEPRWPPLWVSSPPPPDSRRSLRRAAYYPQLPTAARAPTPRPGTRPLAVASGFVHPILSTPILKIWRWSVCRPQTWGGAGRRRAPPLPAAARQAAAAVQARASRRRTRPGDRSRPPHTIGGRAGRGRTVEARLGKAFEAQGRGCRVEAGRSRRWHPVGGIEAPSRAMGGAPGAAWSRPSRAGCGRGFPFRVPSRPARRAACAPPVEGAGRNANPSGGIEERRGRHTLRVPSARAWAWRASLLAKVERIRFITGPCRSDSIAADPSPDARAHCGP